MTAIALPRHRDTYTTLLQAGITVALCLFLFYIDEGNYSLRGLTKSGNLIAMSFYAAGLMSGQALAFLWLKNMRYPYRILLSTVLGLVMGVLITLVLLFALGSLVKLFMWLNI
jgi:hypothetical protein